MSIIMALLALIVSLLGGHVDSTSPRQPIVQHHATIQPGADPTDDPTDDPTEVDPNLTGGVGDRLAEQPPSDPMIACLQTGICPDQPEQTDGP